MPRKKTVLWASAFIGLLILLNLARWAPVLWKEKKLSGRASSGWMQLDFPDPLNGDEKKVRRNLFVLGAQAPEAGRARRVVKTMPSPTPAGTPTPSFPDGSVLEAAGGYRLLGVVSRGSQGQALIGRGSQLYQVGPGDGLEDRYQVLSITENEAYLKESQTGNTVKLRIWNPPVQGTGGFQANGGKPTLEHD